MQNTHKLHPGQIFAPETFKRLDGPDFTFGELGRWQALFVLRGQHCPICKRYLAQIGEKQPEFERLGVFIAAVSADNEEQTRRLAGTPAPGVPVLYGMDETVMRRLGLYVSEPRSAQETDHPFAEPALLVVNPTGVLHIVSVANAPFIRPDIKTLLGGLSFSIENDYPVRGTVV